MPRALRAPLLPTSLTPEVERRMEAEAEGAATELRRRLLAAADETFCCSAARRAAASVADSRADNGTRGMLLLPLRVGDLFARLPRAGRAVRLPLGGAARRAAAAGGDGLGPGMRLLMGTCDTKKAWGA